MDTIKETIGCDLGDKLSEIYILLSDEKAQRPKPVRTTEPAMRAFFTRPPAHVVIEVGTHSRWVSELLIALGHQVTIANPRRVQLIAKGNSKSDRKDAELLARRGRADRGLLGPVEHRGHEVQEELAVAKARDTLVATRTKLVNHVRGVVKSFGKRLPSCEAKVFHERAAESLPEGLRPALEPILAVLGDVAAKLREYDERIEQIATRHPDVEVLSQPKGVGTLTALVYVLTLENKTRFKKSRMAGAFLGLRPRRDQSGAVDKQLGITKAGDPYLRRLLVNCANHILGPFGEDSDLRRWGLSLASRGVARKLAVLMHRLWVTGEIYQPLGYAARAA